VTPQDEWVFGKVENPEELPDFTPIAFTLVGYDRDTREEHDFTFHARSTTPFGASIDIMRELDSSDPTRNNAAAVRFIEDCLEPTDRERWQEVVHDGALHFERDTLAQLAQKLVDYYFVAEGGEGTLPSPPRSVRRNGSRQTGGTTTVEHAGRVSTSEHFPPDQP
jgi:hypothetical protein